MAIREFASIPRVIDYPAEFAKRRVRNQTAFLELGKPPNSVMQFAQAYFGGRFPIAEYRQKLDLSGLRDIPPKQKAVFNAITDINLRERTMAEIAYSLDARPGGFNTLARKVYRRLGVSNRTEATVLRLASEARPRRS